MVKIKLFLKLIVTGLPLISIIGASFLPLQNTGRHLLMLFTLIWYMIFIMFEVWGR